MVCVCVCVVCVYCMVCVLGGPFGVCGGRLGCVGGGVIRNVRGMTLGE